MAKTTTWANDILLLLFNNTNSANIGDATGLRGSSTAGSLYISLHTADPGVGGSQTTSEISYTGYARVPVARSGSGFTITTNSCSPASNITFGTCTAGSGTATYFGIGTALSGAGVLLYSGTVTPNLSVSTGGAATPVLTTASTVTES